MEQTNEKENMNEVIPEEIVKPQIEEKIEEPKVKKQIAVGAAFKQVGSELKKNKFLLVGIVVLLLVGLLYYYKGIFIAATVNGKPIFRWQVTKELEKQGGSSVLQTMVSEELVFQEAKKKGVGVSQQEIDDQMKQYEQSASAQSLTLDQALQQQGMTKSDLTKVITENLLIQKLLSDKVSVTDKEVTDYIAANKESFPDATDSQTLSLVKQYLEQSKLREQVQPYIDELKKQYSVNTYVMYPTVATAQ